MEVEGKQEQNQDGKGMAGIHLENWNYLARNIADLKEENNPIA